MPKGYENLRDAFKKQGLDDKAAKKKAARIWNSRNPASPVGKKEKPMKKMMSM